MKTIVPSSIEMIPAAYGQDLTAAVVAGATLIAILLLTFLVVRATFTIVKLFVKGAIVANGVAMGLLATVIIIGLLNR